MILDLLVTTALAGKAPTISSDKDAPTPVWIRSGAVAVDISPYDGRGCHVKPDPYSFPDGIHGTATLVYVDVCGDAYAMVRFPHAIGWTTRREYAFLERGDLSTEPPKTNVWENRPSTGVIKVVAKDGEPARAMRLDADAGAIQLLARGEELEVLDPEGIVVRDRAGHELIIAPWNIGRYKSSNSDGTVTETDRDPFQGAEPQARALAERFIAGKLAHQQRAPISTVPASADLLARIDTVAGHAFELDVDPKWLTTDRRFSSEWLDPTGQVLDHACDPRDRMEFGTPCGRYWLDYSAFGAWWPIRETQTIAVADGTIDRGDGPMPVLRIAVKHAWTDHVRVSPLWDGVDPGADEVSSPP